MEVHLTATLRTYLPAGAVGDNVVLDVPDGATVDQVVHSLRIPRELERLTAERARLAAALADGATYRLPGEELEGLLKRQAALSAAIETAEHRWLEAAEALEHAAV